MVLKKVCALAEDLPTLGTLILLHSRLTPLVRSKEVLPGEYFPTTSAFEDTFLLLNYRVPIRLTVIGGMSRRAVLLYKH